VPHELQRIVAKALRKDREQRYQSIADLRLDLEALRSELQSGATNVSAAFSASAPAATTPPPAVRRESSAEFILAGLGRHKLATAAGLLAAAAVVASAIWWIYHRPVATIAAGPHVQRNLTRLTFGAGLQTDPSLSPDGRFLAFASDRAGNFDIWAQPVAGGDPVQVTKGPESDTQPAWSPDGSTIVFRSERNGGGLFAVPALGGQVRQLTSFGERPAWSRDGTELLFMVGPSIGVGAGVMRLYAVSLEGGSPIELAPSVLEHGYWKWIAERPDGRLSALGLHEKLGTGFFTFTRTGDHLVSSDVSGAKDLIRGGGLERFRFLWNRTGNRLYVESTQNAVQNLWRVDVDPNTLAWLSSERLTTGQGNDIDAVLSADGTHLAYVQQSSSARLWWFPFDAAGRLGTGRPFSEEGAAAELVDLTLDGSAAVYNLRRSGEDRLEIWSTRLDTGESQLLVSDGSGPKWAANGRDVVFTRFRKDDASVMLRQADGVERQLSPWGRRRSLLVTASGPDAHSVLITASGRDGAPLWLWGTDGLSDKPQKILFDLPRSNVWQARVSPNGRWLAFIPETIGAPDPPKIVVAAMDRTPVTRWTVVAPAMPNTDKPRWSPDGRVLYFMTRGGTGFYNLNGIHFDPARGVTVGEPFQVTHFDSPSLAISPFMNRSELGVGTHRAALTMISSTGSVWMLDNADK
jgi:Tol biopolymer transport system component